MPFSGNVGGANPSSVFPASLDTFDPGLWDPAIALATNAIETHVGTTASPNFLPITGGTLSGAVAMGSNKITGLANGSSSSDAAAFGQIPLVYPLNGMYQINVGGGEIVFQPTGADLNSIQMATGTIIFSYGIATRTETINSVTVPTGGVAATNTTLAEYGIYTVDGSGNLTRVALTTNNALLWNVAYQSYNGIDVKGTLTASYTKQAGQLYAIGALWVGPAGDGATLVGSSVCAGDAGSALAAGICSQLTGQASLPSTVAVGALGAQGEAPMFVLLP